MVAAGVVVGGGGLCAQAEQAGAGVIGAQAGVSAVGSLPPQAGLTAHDVAQRGGHLGEVRPVVWLLQDQQSV